MACLYLPRTFLWRRRADVPSTLAFPLIAIGLVFLLGRRRSGPRAALGGIVLSTSVAVNPLIGVFGMQVASLGTIVEWLDFRRGFVVRVLALAGGVLVTAARRAHRQHDLLAALGAAAPGARRLPGVAADRPRQSPGLRRTRGKPTPWARLAVVVGAPLMPLYFHASREVELFPDD